jgi:helicase
LFRHQDLVKPINELRIRVGSGVKRELIPLVRLEGIGRARARALFNAGLKTVEDLRTVTATDLMAIPMIGPKLAKKIREQAGGTIKSEEWETLKQGTSPDEQSLLTDYSDS